MMYILLIECLLVCLFIAFYISYEDLLSPACLFIFAFVFVTLCALLGRSTWNGFDLSIVAFFVVLIGCISFLFGCWLADPIKEEKSAFISAIRNNELHVKKVSTWKIIVLIIFVALTAYLKIKEIKTIGGGVDLSSSIAKTRYATNPAFTDSDSTENFSFTVKQFDKIVFIIGFVAAYLLVFNFKKESFICKVTVIALWISCAAYGILSGSRGSSLIVLVSPLLAIPIRYHRNGNNKKKSSLKLFGCILIAAAILLPIFYYSIELFGRSTKTDIIEYLSFYFGAGLPSLIHALSIPQSVPTLPFYNTFYGIWSIISGFTDISLPAYSSEWLNLGGHFSNIYTCFYRYFMDMRWIGVVVFSALSGFVYTKLFRIACKTKQLWFIPCWLNVVRTIIDAGRDELLIGHMLTTFNFYVLCLYTILIMYFLYGEGIFRKKLK